jgi:hypothetical protein
MLAIPDHDALIVELVAKAPPPTNIVALDALAQLHSPMLRAVCERVLEDAANPAQRNLVNTALLILESLDGPVPLSLLAPYLQSPYPEHVSDMTSDVVALLARGDADELRLLDSLYGTRANRLGWRDLCNGIDHDARLGDYGDVWQCRRNATNGEHSVAIATDRVWLRSPRLNGPAWLGTLALASPYRRFVEPWRYDVQSLQIDAHSVQLTGIERYQDSSKPVPFQFAAAVREPLRDSDHDGIPDDTERCLGTSPIANDSDGDGLLDPVDPSPLVKTEPADPRAAIVNAVLKHVARFEWSELESVAVLDASPGFESVTEGVAAVTLPAKPEAECFPRGTDVFVHPDSTARPKRRECDGSGTTIHVENVTKTATTGSVRLSLGGGCDGRTIVYDLSNASGTWRVMRTKLVEQWEQ